MRHLPLTALRVLRSELSAALQISRHPPPVKPTNVPIKRQPIVLVHGYLASPRVFRPLMARLHAEGWTHLHTVRYASTRLSFEQIIDRVASSVQTHGAQQPVVLIGHSLGAVAGRAVLKVRGGDRWVKRFISIGGPHHGTRLFRLLPPWLQPALHPRGPWVRRLSEGPEPVQTTVIRARYDQQVLPPWRASLAGVDELVLEDCGHNGLLVSPRAHEAVLRCLEDADDD